MRITFEVYEEMSVCQSLIKSLAIELQKGTIVLIESSDFSHLVERYSGLGVGELSVIASTCGGIAFIEDRKAEEVADAEGIPVFNIPELLFVCKKKGLVDKSDLVQIIDELRAKDGYVLRKDVECELIDV
jgi:predicted nucleic acid-binding protein